MKKFLSILVVALVLVGCGGSGGFNEKKLLTEEEVKTIFVDSSKVRDKSVRTAGQISSEPVVEKDQVVFEAMLYPDDYEGKVVIYAPKTDETYKREDYVKIDGVVVENFDSATSNNELLDYDNGTPVIEAVKVEKSTYDDSINETLDTLEVKETATDNKVTATVEKIEFSRRETRVYVDIKNDSKEKMIYVSFDKVGADGTEVDSYQTKGYYSKIEVLSDKLKAGETASGIMLLPPIDSKKLEFLTFKITMIPESFKTEAPNIPFNITVKDKK